MIEFVSVIEQENTIKHLSFTMQDLDSNKKALSFKSMLTFEDQQKYLFQSLFRVIKQREQP